MKGIGDDIINKRLPDGCCIGREGAQRRCQDFLIDRGLSEGEIARISKVNKG